MLSTARVSFSWKKATNKKQPTKYIKKNHFHSHALLYVTTGPWPTAQLVRFHFLGHWAKHSQLLASKVATSGVRFSGPTVTIASETISEGLNFEAPPICIVQPNFSKSHGKGPLLKFTYSSLLLSSVHHLYTAPTQLTPKPTQNSACFFNSNSDNLSLPNRLKTLTHKPKPITTNLDAQPT